MLLHQLKTWMYWKSKVRILQLWSNYKLYNIPNPYLLPILSMIGPLLGIAWSFILGFGISWLYQHFISDAPYHLWQIIFFITIIEAVDRGIRNGRWISSTNEERWLLSSTAFSTTKYLLFLWIDEEIWQNKTEFLSTLAGLIGVFIIFPVDIINLLMVLIFLNLLGVFIALGVTLIQYYIIRKSVYLKGRGVISNIFVPYILMIAAFFGTKHFIPWIVQFPTASGRLFYEEYIEWLKAIIEPSWGVLQQFIFVFNYDFYPYSLLANYVMNGNFQSIIFFSLYILGLIFICILLFKLISAKDHVAITKKTRTDELLQKFFMKMNYLIASIEKGSLNNLHVGYFMSSILQNYLTKRNIFAVFGAKLWVYAAITLGIILYAPEQLIGKFILVIAFYIGVFYPIYFLWVIYSKLKIKLSFESEGTFLQVLMGYGATPQYIYSLKTRVLRILAFPSYFFILLLSLIILPISWYLVVIIALQSVMVFLIVSNFILIPSFVLPHYEFFNKQQIGEYPDQVKMLNLVRSLMVLLITPTLPILMYLTSRIEAEAFMMFTILWVLLGTVITYQLLNRIYHLRLNTFNIEEISISRSKSVDGKFWRTRGPLLVATIFIYLVTIFFTLTGDFLIAGVVYILPMIVIKLILMSSFRISK